MKIGNINIKKGYLILFVIICLILNFILVTTVLIPSYKEYKERKIYEEQLKNATIIVELKDNLTVPFYDDVRISDFILNINGDIIDNYKIDTTNLGENIVDFKYVNEEDIIIPYSFKINVIDDIAPVIWLGNSYSVTTLYDGDLLEDIVCADNYDDNPRCEIIGDYDTKVEGTYDLVYKAIDSSDNVTEKKFKLKVVEPSSKNNKPNNSKPSYTYFNDVVTSYKKDNIKIGIDVSSWQGDIDFEAVKKAGVEFAFIRIGSTKGINEDYFLDKKFIQNIEGFKDVGIPVGIYFYSYANSRDKAVENAKWVLNEVKDYKIDLPIAYDWENWSFYNEFEQSFYSTSMNAKAFLDTVSEAGYQGLLYSSKNYLEKVWFDIGYDTWLAHYTSKTNYQGNYSFWQLCSNGQVDGIKGNVDIDIMYIN